MPTRVIYCAGCQMESEHAMLVDKNREIVADCSICRRVLHFPLVDSPAELNALIAAHKTASAGQITVEQAATEQAIYDEKFMKVLGIGGG